MAGPVTTKLRLVRCPRCHRLLQEAANVPVYKCGGCDTVLQAKKRKNETKDTDLHIPGTGTVQNDELEHASVDREAQSISQEETLSSAGELPLEKNNGSDEKENKDGDRGQSGDSNLSSELSTELTGNGNEESSPEVKPETEIDQDKCSLEPNSREDRNEYVHCNGKQTGGINFSNEVASSTELSHRESEEPSPVAGAHSEVDERRSCLEEDKKGVNVPNEVASSTELNHLESEESSPVAGAHSGVDESRSRLEEDNGGGNFSGEVGSSTELNHLESEGSSLVAEAPSEVDDNRNRVDQDNERNQSEYGICHEKKPGGTTSNEIRSSTELNHLESEKSSPVDGAHSKVDEKRNHLGQENRRNQNEYGYCNGGQPGGVNFSDKDASSTELNHHEIEESLPVAGSQSEAEENRNFSKQKNGRNQTEFGDCKRECPGNTMFTNEESFCVIGTDRKLDENFKSAVSPRIELLEQSQKRADNGFDRVSSVDTLENIALTNYSSEFSVTNGNMPNFPSTRCNYGYNGSVSSYDGTDDQVSDLHLSRRKFKKPEYPSARPMPRRDGVLNIAGYREMQHQAWNCSSIPSEKKHYATKGSRWRQDELLEPTRHSHQVRSRQKFKSGERLSRVPFYSRGSQVGYEKGKDFQCSTSYHSSIKRENPEEEKMELLKMVSELQDQLNRTRISKGMGNDRFPGVGGTQKRIPPYYDRVAQEVEICPRRCNQGKRRPNQGRIPRIPFSAEATINRCQVDHSCFHCCPHDCRSSAPLPPHISCNKSPYSAHQHSPRYFNPYCSSPLSPLHYPGSEFSLHSHNTNSDDRWHEDHEVKKQSRERNRLKRHVRPVAGGAPFVICYRCSELLQLPLDFLLSKRRCHKLKCSACLNTLKFSLQNGTRLYPYTDSTPDAIAPPPSEVDDYGPSLGKSCSTEGEPFSVVLPLHALKRGSNDRKVSSGSSFEPMEERKRQLIFNESQSKNKTPVETFAAAAAAARPPSKMSRAEKFSSEIEELNPRSVSPLHRLMGYTSASDVMDR